ncbi:SH3 domain-containing protein [Roseomonas indoligenes]|uniref:SH3 domain-containing protein n=1 Tax=Roseomonas indoligenes TaxID=2820811 RepID=A0A940MWW9_9PROT|nr:SH3 domain-containing protein [Pararoseomonas indoligenes]MBP0494899.1 SH3 domain-containing protein [Pararoseomonas indoligenes]
MRKGFLLVGLLALGGCLEDAAPKPAAKADDGAMARVRTAAEERVRGVARDANTLRFRAVETYRQAMADTYAVCGQATVAGDAVYIPFVSVVSQRNGATEVEQFIGRSNVEATRVYVELVGRCFEGGGPVQRAGGTTVSAPTPPLPNGLPVLDQVQPVPPATPDLVTAASNAAPANAAAGTVVMRQNGNVRTSPGGGGAVLRVARSGTVMNVFGTAPGGWFQVGETEPEGWVHSSVAARQSSAALASVQ